MKLNEFALVRACDDGCDEGRAPGASGCDLRRTGLPSVHAVLRLARVTSRRRAGLILLLLVTLSLRVGVAVPQLAAAELRAVSCCTEHEKRPRSVADASQCCQVANAAGDRALLGNAPSLPPAPPVMAMLPRPTTIVAPASARVVESRADLQRDGPPRFLLLRTLLI
jgi:hypothetical protein